MNLCKKFISAVKATCSVKKGEWTLRNTLLYYLKIDQKICPSDNHFKQVTSYTPEEYYERFMNSVHTENMFELWCDTYIGLFNKERIGTDEYSGIIIDRINFIRIAETHVQNITEFIVKLDDFIETGILEDGELA